eukprot:scaffold100841_cov68-Cyclotella_meneghiniana.AAC.1
MTCCANPHNIVDSKHATAGAPSPPMAIVQMTIEGGRCALGGRSWPLHPFPLRFPFMQNTAKMKGICGGNGRSGHGRPSGANRGLQLLSKLYLQAADEAPAVGGPVLTMLWEVQSSQQVIVKRLGAAATNAAVEPHYLKKFRSAAASKAKTKERRAAVGWTRDEGRRPNTYLTQKKGRVLLTVARCCGPKRSGDDAGVYCGGGGG